MMADSFLDQWMRYADQGKVGMPGWIESIGQTIYSKDDPREAKAVLTVEMLDWIEDDPEKRGWYWHVDRSFLGDEAIKRVGPFQTWIDAAKDCEHRLKLDTLD